MKIHAFKYFFFFFILTRFVFNFYAKELYLIKIHYIFTIPFIFYSEVLLCSRTLFFQYYVCRRGTGPYYTPGLAHLNTINTGPYYTPGLAHLHTINTGPNYTPGLAHIHTIKLDPIILQG